MYRRTQPKSSGLVFGRRPLGAVLHSSNETGELSQWLCHDDSTINIVWELLLLKGACPWGFRHRGLRLMSDISKFSTLPFSRPYLLNWYSSKVLLK